VIKDITLGQYFPGNTAVHRLDPRAKIIMTVLYIVALFSAKYFFSYGVMLVLLATAVVISKVKPSQLFRGLKPIIIIVIITGVLNLFYTRGEPVLEFWVFRITREGIRAASFMIIRIVMLIAGTFLLTYTTSPMMLTDGLEILLGPLKKIRLPIHELALMMSIALRFIPTLIEETDKIMNAQKARGADLESGNIIKRAKAMVPILVPLFVSAFRRADELALAMESRCYSGGEGRTRMKTLHMRWNDVAALVVFTLITATVVILGRYGL
jgi:energy-coupling factor transport system permease protein